MKKKAYPTWLTMPVKAPSSPVQTNQEEEGVEIYLEEEASPWPLLGIFLVIVIVVAVMVFGG